MRSVRYDPCRFSSPRYGAPGPVSKISPSGVADKHETVTAEVKRGTPDPKGEPSRAAPVSLNLTQPQPPSRNLPTHHTWNRIRGTRHVRRRAQLQL
eukprot:3369691-Prymnesium_polylepis.1